MDDLVFQTNLLNIELCAFALADCTIEIESQSAKYLRAVHRTALELAVQNLYGVEIGGFWLEADQIDQLRTLPECYPANEQELVRAALETYLSAQTENLQVSKETFYEPARCNVQQRYSLSADLKDTI